MVMTTQPSTSPSLRAAAVALSTDVSGTESDVEHTDDATAPLRAQPAPLLGEQSPSSSPTSPSSFSCLFSCIQHRQLLHGSRNANWILLLVGVIVVGILWPVGFVSFHRLSEYTDSTVQPLPGTPSQHAQEAFAQAYRNRNPNKNHNHSEDSNSNSSSFDPLHPPLYMVLQSTVLRQSPCPPSSSSSSHLSRTNSKTNSTSSLSCFRSLIADAASLPYQAARQFTRDLRTHLQSHPWSWIQNNNNDNNNTIINNSSVSAVQLVDYYSLVDQGLSMLATNLASPDGSRVILTLNYNGLLQQHQLVDVEEDNNVSRSRSQRDKARVHELMDVLQTFGDQYLYSSNNASSFASSSSASSSSSSSTFSWFSIQYTGLPYFQADLAAEMHQDLRRMDLFVVPTALLCMGWALSPTLAHPAVTWIIPLVSIITAMAGWSIVMAYIAQSCMMQITQFTPTLMMSLTLGLGIDYTLFLLARFLQEEEETQRHARAREEEEEDHNKEEGVPLPTGVVESSESSAPAPVSNSASSSVLDSRVTSVSRMLTHSGHVLLVSGSTLMCTFLGLAMLPLPMLQSVGVGAAVAIACTLMANLLVVPALLLSPIGRWIVRRPQQQRLSSSSSPPQTIPSSPTPPPLLVPPPFPCDAPSTTNHNREDSSDTNNLLYYHDSDHDHEPDHRHYYHPFPLALDRSLSSSHNHHHRQHSSSSSSSFLLPPPPTPTLWYRLATHLLHPYRGIVLLLVTVQLILPIAWFSTQLQSSISFDLLLPRNSAALHTFSALSDVVGPGHLNPTRILFQTITGSSNRSNSSNHSSLVTRMTSSEGFDVMHRVVNALIRMEAAEREEELLEKYAGASDSIRSTAPRASSILAPPIQQHKGSRGSLSEEDIAAAHAQWTHSVSTLLNQSTVLTINSLSSPHEHESSRSLSSLSLLLQPPLLGRKRRTTKYNGVAVLQNTLISHAVFVSAKLCSQLKPYCPVELLHVLDALDKMTTSSDGGHATYMTAALGVDPFSDEGVTWLTSARQVIDRMQDNGELQGVQVYIQSTAAIEYDAQREVYRSFPWMVLSTTVVIFVLMGAFFGSVFLPLRSVVSIGTTLAFTYGLGVLVFQKDFAAWTRVQAFSSVQNEFCWLVPIMSFSLITGLALDYDVFLVSRILEYRMLGYEHKSSIAAALEATGGIITCAGLIMAFAFGSLLFSSSPLLCQWSFLITTAVLLDTFVVRTMIVPIVTNLAGSRRCWWPRQLPDPEVTMPDFLGSMDDVGGLVRTLERSSEYESLRMAAESYNNGSP